MVLLPAVALSALRVFHPTFGPMVMLTAFAPYAVLLYTAALLVLLLKRTQRWLAFPVALLLALHGWWLVPPFVGDPAAPSDDSFTVMTSNLLLGKADAASVMTTVVDQDVDVLVLQEVRWWQYMRLQDNGIDAAFPFRTLRSTDELTGTVVFSRFPLKDETALPTTQSGQRVTVEVPGGPVTLLAVHSARGYKDEADDWLADHGVIAKEAEALRGPALIAGDLNASVDHAPIRHLAELGFDDTADLIGAGWQPTWPSGNGIANLLGIPIPPLFRIDHVLVNRELAVIGSRTVSIKRTDHRAVVAELAVR